MWARRARSYVRPQAFPTRRRSDVAATAIVHDYLTQRGGAERVVLAMARALPGAPVHTSLYDPAGTFDEFGALDVHPSPLSHAPLLRKHHRLALPALATTFSSMRIDADVVLCSSSGWAHGVHTDGRKVVYCHSPAKWLHQRERYAAGGIVGAVACRSLQRWLLDWDRRAAASADEYLVNSTAVRGWVRSAYGIDAQVLPPPGGVDANGTQRAVARIEPGFFLCVSRLLAYKNVDVVVEAFRELPADHLVVVGHGPQLRALEAARPPNVRILQHVGDDELRWLYAHSQGLIAAAYEDFGLTPLEAAAFGRPTAALRWGGYLDTVVDGCTGTFLDRPEPDAVRAAVGVLRTGRWDSTAIAAHAADFSEARFRERLLSVLGEALLC